MIDRVSRSTGDQITAAVDENLGRLSGLAKHAPLILGLAVGVGVKAWLVLTQAVPFNGDEAVVALMARHILRGARPVFFYGQAYMGSLDAWLIAGAFRLFGETVWAIRLVQIALYALFLVTLKMLCNRLFETDAVGAWAVLVAAIPPLVVTTYTTATLGGYGEVLVLGNLVLLLGHALIRSQPVRAWELAAGLGAVSGLSFWTLGLSAVYILPVGFLLTIRFDRRKVGAYVVGLVAFLVASSPWWLYSWYHQGEPLRVALEGSPLETTPWERATGLVLLGIPALVGIRPPWSYEMVPWPVALLLVLIHLAAGTVFLRQAIAGRARMHQDAGKLLLLVCFVFVVTFIGTQFGVDATGRYFLPLYTPVAVALGFLGHWLWGLRRSAAVLCLLALWGLNGMVVFEAAQSSDRITTQFDPITRFDNSYDDELIAFLAANDLRRGYSNYWVTFRLAFLTQEEFIFAPRLPYKPDLRYTPGDDRIPAYSRLADRSSRIAYITTLHPGLNAYLRRAFREQGIAFREADIGPYHVFYDLSRPIRPEELGLGGAR